MGKATWLDKIIYAIRDPYRRLMCSIGLHRWVGFKGDGMERFGLEKWCIRCDTESKEK